MSLCRETTGDEDNGKFQSFRLVHSHDAHFPLLRLNAQQIGIRRAAALFGTSALLIEVANEVDEVIGSLQRLCQQQLRQVLIIGDSRRSPSSSGNSRASTPVLVKMPRKSCG